MFKYISRPIKCAREFAIFDRLPSDLTETFISVIPRESLLEKQPNNINLRFRRFPPPKIFVFGALRCFIFKFFFLPLYRDNFYESDNLVRGLLAHCICIYTVFYRNFKRPPF